MVRRKKLISTSIAVVVAVLGFSCSKVQPPSAAKRSVALVDATVYTFTVTTDRDPKPRSTSLVVSGSKVRLPDELDVWRIIDLDASRVTRVDAVSKSFRSESLEQLMERRRRESATPAPQNIPRLEFQKSNERETVSGIAATAWRLTMGDYRREIFLSDSAVVHERLFPLWIGSEQLGASLVGRSAPVQLKLMGMRGFPVLDRINVPLGARKMMLERRLQRIEKKKVPAALFEIPTGYRDLDAKEPDGDRRSASSRRNDRTTPAEGSPPSAKSEKNP